MWACSRGHKSAMLILNQFNPVALLSLANRYTMAPGRCDVTMTSSGLPPDQRGDEVSRACDVALRPVTSLLDKDDLADDEADLVNVQQQQSVTVSYSATESSPLHTEPTHHINADQITSSSSLEYRGRRTSRLKKRTSVDTLPCHHIQRRTSTPKISKTASVGDAGEIPAAVGSPDTWPMTVLPPGELRVCNSDSHLSVGLSRADPMISMIDHDINSPPMTFTGDAAEIPLVGFPLGASYLLPCEAMSVDIGTLCVYFDESRLLAQNTAVCTCVARTLTLTFSVL